MPLDAQEVPPDEAFDDDRGLYWIDDDGTAYPWKAVMRAQDLGPIYRAHWGTCRDRETFAR